uniref:S.lividans DNA of Orf1, Orf2 and micX n=1 Tax=Streptomyces lividans TaxID=1916 RepID=Q54393_STRLI|nr:unnamed protein product [Streptomyces lividans]prf//2111287A actinorhodin production activator protein [Streptomyces lividans]
MRATRRTRVADSEGVRRRRRATATRKAGEVPVKAWARALPSVAWIPVGSVRTQVTPSMAAPRTCQSAACSSRRMGRPSSSMARSTEPWWSPVGVVSRET